MKKKIQKATFSTVSIVKGSFRNFKESMIIWIFDKTNRPASHPRGVHDKTDYEVAL